MACTNETKNVYGTNYLKEHLPYYPHKKIPKFYRVEAITEDPDLFGFAVDQMCEMIKRIGKVDGLATSEARGFLFAAIAKQLHLPLYLVRKKGKLPGPTDGETYQKSYDEMETIEISLDSNVAGKNIVIIDDGLASGSTTTAMYNLLTRQNANVVHAVFCIKHTYVACQYDETPYDYVFEL